MSLDRTGASTTHNLIVQNLSRVLANEFMPKGSRVFTENVKLLVEAKNFITYPDVMLTCDEEDLKAEYIVSQASLIVEVLSLRTQDHDRGSKLKKYMKMGSVKAILFVKQEEYGIELFTRPNPPSLWNFQLFTELEEKVSIPSLDFTFSVSDAYSGITLPTKPEESEEKVE